MNHDLVKDKEMNDPQALADQLQIARKTLRQIADAIGFETGEGLTPEGMPGVLTDAVRDRVGSEKHSVVVNLENSYKSKH